MIINNEECVASDTQLVLNAQNGDDKATTTIIMKYYSLAKSLSREYFLPGGEREDLEQEALIGLFRAIHSFDPQFGNAFSGFARMCISRQLITAVKVANRQKYEILNKSISLDSTLSGDSEMTLLNIIPSSKGNPEIAMMEIESHGAVWEAIHRKLSPLEKQVLALRLRGYDYATIAIRLNRSIKAVDNATHRIRVKAAAVMKKLGEMKMDE